MEPTLSICIPTYNRADLLKSMLHSLVPQIKQLNGEVEVIVSDNCSSDHTQQVVKQVQNYAPIFYHRNTKNRGAVRNILILTNELAKGQFCWILGDDDMVVRGKLSKIIDILKTNSNLDYFFVNYFFKSIDERNFLIQENDSVYIPDPSECMCKDFSERYIDKWDDLLRIESLYPPLMFTSIVCHLFRRSMWCSHTSLLDIDECKIFSSLDNSFPQLKIFAYAMIGKPAYYIGDPCVLLGQGSQEWLDYWPVIKLVHMQTAFNLYEKLGIDSGQVCRLRKMLLKNSGSFVLKMLTELECPGREYFSLFRFIWFNRHCLKEIYIEFTPLMKGWMIKNLPNPVRKFLRIVKSYILRTE